MMKTKYTTIAMISAMLIASSPLVNASNTGCQQLLDRLEHLQVDSIAYNHEINKVISPKAQQRFDTLGEKREVPKGLHDEIRQTFNHYLISDCRKNPKQYTHTASQNAIKDTKDAVKDYLEYRK
ncbi:MAG: hypothetical protein V7739_13015 [Motiliproteus sp.]